MNSQLIKKNALLLLAAVIWGVAFVAQTVGMDYVGPFTFNAVRCFLGALVLLPAALFSARKKAAAPGSRRTLWLGGLVCGTALAVASSLQQVGLLYTSAGKAGFITALYIVIVPLLGLLVFRRRVSFVLGISILLSVAGMYLLCLTGGLSLGTGDLLMLLCAFFFAVQILCVDYFSPRLNAVQLSCLQFFFCGIVTCILMFIFEKPNWESICAAYIPLLYAGIFSCGVAYTLQILGQKGFNPTVASLILSLESVFSALAGWILLGEKLSPAELGGCALIFAAIILAQLPERKKQTAK